MSRYTFKLPPNCYIDRDALKMVDELKGYHYELPPDTSTPEEEEWFLELEKKAPPSKPFKEFLEEWIKENKNEPAKTKLDRDREAFSNRANERESRACDTSPKWEPDPLCICGYRGREDKVPLRSHSDWCDYKISRASDKGV